MTVGLTHIYEFHLPAWDCEEIIPFFSEHPAVFACETVSFCGLLIVIFGLDERDITRGAVKFIDSHPCAMNIFTIIDPESDEEKQLNADALANAEVLFEDIKTFSLI